MYCTTWLTSKYRGQSVIISVLYNGILKTITCHPWVSVGESKRGEEAGKVGGDKLPSG